MKTIFSFVSVLFMLVATFFGSFSSSPSDLIADESFSKDTILSSDEKALLAAVFEEENQWLASLQLENGAIPMTATKNGVVSVNPYFADFAAIALLNDAAQYSENVKKYMDWHFSHLNTSKTDYNGVDGTIYDYSITLNDGNIVKEEVTVKDGKSSYDSTDSYSATFLILLEKYYKNTNDKDYILNNAADIVRITDSMFSTFNMGLTYAKPDYQVKYLMDNCEVFQGMKSAAEIFTLLASEDSSFKMMQIKCSRAYDWMKQSIENKLWNEEYGHYESAVFKDGTVAFEFSWANYYPDATAQLFPIMYGVISPETVRANELYQSFCDNYKWEDFEIPSEFCWGINVYVAAMMNDCERVLVYMENYSELYAEHKYPLYNADAAKVSMAAFELLSKAV